MVLMSGLLTVLLLADSPAPGHKTTAGDALSEPTRRAIAQRMAHHGVDLTDLLKAIVILDHDAVVDRVQVITEEPKLSRPRDGETGTLNASLPRRFFDLQDDLADRAAAVKEAAQAHDDARMGKAFGQLAESCVNCHRVYLWQPSVNGH